MPSFRQQARRLHTDSVLIDGHNDHFFAACYNGRSRSLLRLDRSLNSDVPRLARAGLTASAYMVGGWELDTSLMMMEWARREIESHPDRLVHVRKTADLRLAQRTGRYGVLFSWESCNALMNRMEVLHAAYRLGLRCSTLTYNDGGGEHSLQGSPLPRGYCTPAEREVYRHDAKGLTPFGREVVPEMNRLGVLVDIAHANDATIEDALAITTKPIVSTHGAAFALCPHVRSSTDEQLRGLAATGGLIGILVHNPFLMQPKEQATLNTMVDHITYVADLIGIDHVAIGTDLGAMFKPYESVMNSPADFLKLTEIMLRRGFAPADVRKVWGENWLRVLRATIG